MLKIMYISNTSWYLFNFRSNIMQEMLKNGWEVVGVAPDDGYAESLKDIGVRFINLTLDRKGLNPLKDLRLLYYFIRLYHHEKPTIVHHFTIKPVIYGSIAARLVGIPRIVNSIEGLGYVFLKGGILQSMVEKMYKFALRPPAQVIFLNPDDQNIFLERKLVTYEQIHLIHGTGVNTELFSPSNFIFVNALPKITFILIARMLWDKGVAEFVKVAKKVKEQNPLTHFILLGGTDSGSPSAISISWLKQQNKHGFIEWIDHVDDVRPYLAKSSVVVLPSYKEGLPRSLIEAAAMAKPIITTDTPGCREVVKDGINGLLVPKKNVKLLVKAMLTLANDPDLCKRMGHASRERALKYFDERVVIRKTLDVYRKTGIKL